LAQRNVQQPIGWLLFAVIAGFIIWLLTRKPKAQASVTSDFVTLWNSHTDPGPPSYISAPPLQLADGKLVCAAGYSLWKDSATGNLACFKNPDTSIATQSGSIGPPTPVQTPPCTDCGSTGTLAGVDVGSNVDIVPIVSPDTLEL
jgi:hypothetical protein